MITLRTNHAPKTPAAKQAIAVAVATTIAGEAFTPYLFEPNNPDHFILDASCNWSLRFSAEDEHEFHLWFAHSPVWEKALAGWLAVRYNYLIVSFPL